ncbi:hypothetical protein A5320_02685 [Rheinheimera sp. SA_1]|uniref:non-ribosomal peptide synthetase n=1 Tax=Rheinheimera sp. SA_1 TaxID=1827365 RepID=UPI0007FE86E8|nr:non-ribosomal peptide synthetase [Rheinheimera sp. SA_1]OBP16334.1 hypothetical protein A5320_02685 [Rheinheimera sp. SA_1]
MHAQTQSFLSALNARGIRVWVEDGQLCLDQQEAELTSDEISYLQQHKALVLEVLHQQDTAKASPLSCGQTSLWYIQQQSPDCSAYNVTFAAELADGVDAAALEQAVQLSCQRHDMLRTCYRMTPDGPVQWVRSDYPKLNVIVATQWRSDQIEHWIRTCSEMPFQLEKEPVVRFYLLQNQQGDRLQQVLLVVGHHVALDYWSLELLLRELLDIYAAASTAGTVELPKIERTYRDFVALEQAYIQQHETGHLAFFQQYLTMQPLVLQYTYPRPKLQSFQGENLYTEIDPALHAQLRQLAAQLAITPFKLIFSLFSVLLGRLGQTEHFVLGTNVTVRNTYGFESVLGHFVNAIPVGIQLASQQPAASAIVQIAAMLDQALSQQNYPFARLVEKLNPQRDLSRSALFQVVFNWNQKQGTPPGKLLKRVLVASSTGVSGANNDLSLNVLCEPDRYQLQWNYCSALFSRARIESFAKAFEYLLQQVVRDSGQLLADIPCTDAAVTVPEETKATTPFREQHHVLQAFADSVNRYPLATAVRDPAGSLTYQQLDLASSRLAGRLAASGAARGALVALWLPPGTDALVAMLACWKAGVAYLPLDTRTPLAKIRTILATASVYGCISHTAHWQEPLTPLVLWLDEDGDPDGDISLPIPQADAALVAYSIFTSGSTGMPKGVEISHAALFSYLNWAVAAYDVEHGSGAPVLTSLAFDATVTPLFTPLLCGKTVEFVDNPAEVATLEKQLSASQGYSFIKLTPSHLKLLAQGDLSRFAAATRCYVLGGEALDSPLLARWQQALPHARFVNEYGPTETSVGCSVYVSRHPQVIGREVPIGTATANARLYLLDQRFNPLPAGVEGELFIGGEGVANGYRQQPALTALRFLPDPFSPKPGARMYQSGDRAVMREDGQLLYTGREDGQLKVRGHRVEEQEIVSQLRRFPHIAAAVVMTDQQDNLCAYLVMAPTAPCDVTALRQQLSEHLPEYMVPNRWFRTVMLPLTTNGKTDRAALIVAAQPVAQPSQSARPESDTEQRLALLWQELLGVTAVGQHDNFFTLGGHSILAARLLNRVQQHWQVSLGLTDILTAPVLQELACRIDAATKNVAAPVQTSAIAPVDPAGRYEPFALTEVQQAYWIGRQDVYALGGVATHSYFEFDIVDLALDQFSRAWDQLIQRHDMLRVVIDENAQQRVLPEVPAYAIACDDLREKTQDQRQARLTETRATLSHQMLDPARWPLFELRASLLPASVTRLHLSIDALIVDAWSAMIMQRDLSALMAGQGDSLPALRYQFRDFVRQTVQLRQQPVYLQAKDYWLQRLESLPGGPRLPLARRPEQLRQPVFTRRQQALTAEQWQSLQARAQSFGVTPSVLLLTLFSQVIARWSENKQFLINLTLFNRPPLAPEITDLLGDFTSLTLLAVDTVGHDTAQLANRLQFQLWQDLEHRSFSGVEVIRLLANKAVDQQSALVAPVVFTSAIGSGQGEPGNSSGGLGKLVYNISQTSQVWLDHQVTEQQGRLNLSWDSVDDLFYPGVLDGMFSLYIDSVLRCIANATEPVAAPVPLPISQLGSRLRSNSTALALPDSLIYEPFLRQCRAEPQRIAVQTSSLALTYQQLHQYALQQAELLQAAGVKPNELVAIVMHKDWRQVVACLAICYAGAAYLPVDRAQPVSRQLQILQLAAVKIAMVDGPVDDSIARQYQILPISETVFAVDSPFTEPPAVARLDDLAYVIFTSGSTGVPKGVKITHRAVVNTLLDINQRFALTQPVVLGLSALNFDLSVYDIFGVLAAGGTLVLPDAALRNDPSHWHTLSVRFGVDLWNSVPALYQLYLDYLEQTGGQFPAALKTVMLSGDWIPLSLADKARWMAPACRLISLGGATEASIWSIYYEIGLLAEHWRSVPYGRPLANQTFYVLDEQRNPCPDFVKGDLYIGGKGLASGYWQDEKKTADAFIFNPQSGERLYKTGDKGRYIEDGLIEFLGREDTQVKLRGYRVELGEIEKVISQHRYVDKAVVMVMKNEQQHDVLTGYVVFKSLPAPGTDPVLATQSGPSLTETALLPLEPVDISRQLTLNMDTLSDWQPVGVSSPAILSYLLAPLQQVGLAPAAPSKCYYPSASSLYAVQCLVQLNRALSEQLPAGVYLYNPISHGLQLTAIGAVPSDADVVLHLVVDRQKVTAKYGALAEKLWLLEAGHLCSLLEHSMVLPGLVARLQSVPELPLPHWCGDFAAIGSYCLVPGRQRQTAGQQINLLQRQSIRRYTGQALPVQDLLGLLNQHFTQSPACGQWYLQLQRSADSARSPQIFQVVGTAGQLSLLAVPDEFVIPVSAFMADNRVIAEQAALLFHIAPATAGRQTLQRCGYDVQQLSLAVHQQQLGVCPLGHLELPDCYQDLLAEARFSYGVFIGHVAPEQYQQWPVLQEAREYPAVRSVKSLVAEKLPAYMVPEQVFELAALPLSANGKVDRKQLPKPVATEVKRSASILPGAVMTATQQRLQQIWQDVLSSQDIGIDDSFFEAGGNSVMMIQVFNRIKAQFSKPLTIADLFRYSTIASLAAFLDEVTMNQQETINQRSRKQRDALLQRRSNREEQV